MKFTKKLIAALLALAMVISMVACNNGGKIEDTSEAETTKATEKETEKETEATKEESKEESKEETEEESKETEPADDKPVYDGDDSEVTLVLYFTGNEPVDMGIVEDEVNKLTMEKFNCKLDFQFSTWTDYVPKYNNILVTGGVDLIFTADWMNYATLADTGAFVELDELLPKFAPNLTEQLGGVDGIKLSACRINGKIYCVPNMWDEYVIDGICYRKDLADKYSLPYPEETLENVEAYFNGLIEAGYDKPILHNVGSAPGCGSRQTDCAALLVYAHPDWLGRSYGWMYNQNHPHDLDEYWETDDFVEDAKLMKKWCDAGWWSRSCLADESNASALSEEAAVAVVSGANANKYIGWTRDCANAGIEGCELVWYEYAQFNGNSYPVHPVHNGTAITATSKYPERCMAVLDYIMTDAEINKLIQCGIEGTHYNMEDGFYVATQQGLDNYAYEAADTWNFRNDPIKLKQPSDVELEEIFARDAEISNKMLYPLTDIVSGFAESYIEYEAEKTAVGNVCSEQLNPIYAGVVDDPEAACAAFIEAVKAAGNDKCKESYKAQWEAYCDEYGYTATK